MVLSAQVTVVVIVGVVVVTGLKAAVLTVEVNAENPVAVAVTLSVVQLVLGMRAKEKQEHL